MNPGYGNPLFRKINYMHEFSIAMSIVDIATEYAVEDKAEKVKEIEIEIGTLSGVVPEALELAMEAAVKNTICETAAWNIRILRAKMICPVSGREFQVETLTDPCPECGDYGHELTQGNELRVKSLQVE